MKKRLLSFMVTLSLLMTTILISPLTVSAYTTSNDVQEGGTDITEVISEAEQYKFYDNTTEYILTGQGDFGSPAADAVCFDNPFYGKDFGSITFSVTADVFGEEEYIEALNYLTLVEFTTGGADFFSLTSTGSTHFDNESDRTYWDKTTDILLSGKHIYTVTVTSSTVTVYVDNIRIYTKNDIGVLSYILGCKYMAVGSYTTFGEDWYWGSAIGTISRITGYSVALNFVTISEDSTPFDLTVDGYAFNNTQLGFEGSRDYYIADSKTNKIPYNRYLEVYGSNYTLHQYELEKEWAGNCFGMAVSAILMNEGALNLSEYIPTAVNSDANSGTKYSGLGKYMYTAKNSEIKKIIERYQVWQYSTEYSDYITKNDGLTYENLIYYSDGKYNEGTSHALECFDNFYVSVDWKDEEGNSCGHGLVVDSARKPDDLGGGWYRIYLYDPNNPYYEKEATAYHNTWAAWYATSMERYVDINIFSNHWKMNVSVSSTLENQAVGYDDNDNFISGSILRFYKLVGSNLPTSFDGSAHYINSVTVDGTAYTIKDAKGDTILEDVSGSITLSEGEYTIIFAESGTATIRSDDHYVGINADAGTQVLIGTDGVVHTSGNDNTNVIVVHENVRDNDDYTSVKFNVENTLGKETVTSLDENDNLSISGNASYDISVISNKTDDAEYVVQNVSAKDLKNTDITEYALNNGEAVYDLCISEADYNKTFYYTGNSYSLHPTITYKGNVLEEGVDYELSGDVTATEVGTYSVIVTGIGSYIGSLELIYELLPEKLGFSATSVTLGKNICINFAVDKTLFTEQGYENPVVTFEIGDYNVEISDYTETDTQYIFSCENITSAQINNTIYATLYAEFCGIVFESETKEYRVSRCFNNILDDYNCDNYTRSSYIALVTAVQAGNCLVRCGITTQSIVDSIIATIGSAIANLTPKTDVSYTKLQAAIDTAKGYSESDYTLSSYASLKAAVSAGNMLVNNNCETQVIIDGITVKINEAINNLTLASESPGKSDVDYTDLQSALSLAGSYKEKDYTVKSYNALKVAISAGNLIISNGVQTQSIVNAIESAVKNAIKGLEAK